MAWIIQVKMKINNKWHWKAVRPTRSNNPYTWSTENEALRNRYSLYPDSTEEIVRVVNQDNLGKDN
jgi:hypothetical protein